MAHKEKMTFHTVPLRFEAELPPRPRAAPPAGLLQCRAANVPGDAAKAGAAAERAAHAPVQRAARADAASFFLPARGRAERRIRYFLLSDAPPATVPEGLDRALSYARALSRELGENSVSLSSYTAAAEQQPAR